MRKMFILLGVILLTGCLVRTYTIQKPRVDLDIQGNRGYLVGQPQEAPRELKKTRPITIFEIEFGSHPPQVRQPKQRPEESVHKEELPQEEFLQEELLEEELQEEVLSEETAPRDVAPPEKKYTIYTLQKNDTLQKVSKKFYGTTKKWKFLYEENKDVIKNPDKIYPGLKIKIPLAY
jgi:nucleoid-associated protein YgaU